MGEKKYLKLNDVDAYRTAFNLSNYIWDIVVKWDYFARDTIGKNWVRAADSNSSNLAEGFGRYTKKDKVKFYRYTYGSVKECFDSNEKAKRRGLITQEQYDYIFSELQRLTIETNQWIKYTNKVLKF